ncbi:hypothetical protein HK099_008332 [Clydaea vesicula]|uniref:SAP domain-containing protein n=1 Tax=Clydaea vesicula TaxID=447962 RepID=A0AAD5U4W9_9FUNG|nr:hypothetical protein HK099_008332 [Clydaea vesicula]
MKVSDLKIELEKLNLLTSGKKDDLIKRLQDHFANQTHENSTLMKDAPSAKSVELTSANITTPNTATHSEGININQQSLKNTSSPTVTSSLTRTAALTEEERRKLREQKFGTVSSSTNKANKMQDKLHEREKRFGTSNVNTTARNSQNFSKLGTEAAGLAYSKEDLEKMKAREEKFRTGGGLVSAESIGNNVLGNSEEEKKRRREERFGIVKNGDVKV